MKDIGEEVEKLGIEIAKLSFSAQEEALQKKLDHNARLKKEVRLIQIVFSRLQMDSTPT